MNKKVVIAGNASLQKEIKKWIDYWNDQKDHEVIEYARPVKDEDFVRLYPKVHEDFFRNITEADILFVANEDKNGTKGYIGAEVFAEIAFAVAQNLLYEKGMKIILAKMPGDKVQSFDDIELWLKLGWIEKLGE